MSSTIHDVSTNRNPNSRDVLTPVSGDWKWSYTVREHAADAREFARELRVLAAGTHHKQKALKADRSFEMRRAFGVALEIERRGLSGVGLPGGHGAQGDPATGPSSSVRLKQPSGKSVGVPSSHCSESVPNARSAWDTTPGQPSGAVPAESCAKDGAKAPPMSRPERAGGATKSSPIDRAKDGRCAGLGATPSGQAERSGGVAPTFFCDECKSGDAKVRSGRLFLCTWCWADLHGEDPYDRDEEEW